MSGSPVFILDANVFITASRRYYAFDLVPPFWSALIEHANVGHIVSVDRVRDEISRGNDDLSVWADGDFHHAFQSTNDTEVLARYAEIVAWSQNQNQYNSAAKAEFARAENADPWLVAYAAVHGGIVVTHEVIDPNVRRKIPIPNVCNAYGVECTDTYDMLRSLKIRLG